MAAIGPLAAGRSGLLALPVAVDLVLVHGETAVRHSSFVIPQFSDKQTPAE
jgi:hypothetical protein